LRVEKVELRLLYLGLLIAMFYFPLRSVLFDSWVWLGLIPGLMLGWILVNPLRYLNLKLNAVDVGCVLYFVFGLIITTLGIVVFSSNNQLVLQTFAHYYLPTLFYFIARAAFATQPSSAVGKIGTIMVVIALLWAVSFLCEYYVVWILKQPLSIPWVNAFYDATMIANSDAEITFNHLIVRTILVGNPKIVGLFSAILFVLILPMFFRDSLGINDVKTFFKFVLIGLLLCALLYIQLYYGSAVNKTVLLTMGAVSVYITLRSVSLYKAFALFIAVVVIVGLLFSENLSDSFRTYISPVKTSMYQPDASGSLQLLLKTVEHFEESMSDDDWEDYLIGSYNSIDSEEMFQGVGDGVELRVFLLPGYFGLIWTVLILFIIIGLIIYSYKVSSVQGYKVFGLMALGLMLVSVTDIHYPTIIRHGPLEVLMIVSGSLSAVYNSCRASNVVS